MEGSIARAPVKLRHSPAQVRLIRRSVCKDLSDAEFDLFMEVAETAALDPLRRQIAPLVIKSGDERRMVPWTTIDGLRVIAARSGDYRPMGEPVRYEQSDVRIDAACNPLGLVRAEVRAWKRHGRSWHAIVGEAWWDEYAPVRRTPVRGEQDLSAAARAEVIELDPSWRRMSRVMLGKCAEAQALRRGWPDILSGLYSEEELDRLRLDSASVRAQRSEAEGSARLAAGSRAMAFVLGPEEGVVTLALDNVVPAMAAHVASLTSVAAIDAFRQRNQSSLQALWSRDPERAHQLKLAMETRAAALAPERKGVSTRASEPRTRRRKVLANDATDGVVERSGAERQP